MADLLGLSERAAHTLCRAYRQHFFGDCWFYMINRQLGWNNYANPKPTKRASDLWELRKAGLIYEWFNPGAPPMYVTEDGMAARAILRERLGYNK